jgi:DNA processing protein
VSAGLSGGGRGAGASAGLSIVRGAGACDACLRRAWLLARLSGHLDRQRSRIWELLELNEEELISAVAGRFEPSVRAEWVAFGARDAARARELARGCGLDLICRCGSLYPERLRDLPGYPAVLHVAGGLDQLTSLCAADAVAVVGARKATPYGTTMARSLARGLGSARLTVVSGMAAGIDTAAHRGALEAGALTIAVLPGSTDRADPPTNSGLHREIVRRGVAVSGIPPDTPLRNWMFAARNRVIAALSGATVVVQATSQSGSLLTARGARQLERPIGAVPGQVTSQLSAGTHQLLADGARMIRDAQDVLDLLYGVGARSVVVDSRPMANAAQAALLAAIGDGLDTAAALVGARVAGDRCLAELAALELAGRVRRGPGGQLALIP